MNFHQGKIGLFLILFLAGVPLLWWLPTASFTPYALGQIAGLIGSVLLSLNFILSARLRLLEPLFHGLNRMYLVHAFIGSLSFLLLLIHPAFILYNLATISLESAVALITPSPNNLPVLLGITAFAVMLLLIILTKYIKIPYQQWKSTHQWFGLVLLFGSLHAMQVGSTITANPGLRAYLFVLYTAGLGAFIYRKLAPLHQTNHYTYIVDQVATQSNTTIFTLKPKKNALPYQPGQFAFFTFKSKGVPQESHPFSLVSAPHEPYLMLAAKQLGDFTKTLTQVQSGDEVIIEGAFGKFTYAEASTKKQVWIAGGIGITPFMSMLAALPHKHDYEIVLVYLVRNEKEALFIDQIKTKAQKKQIQVIMHVSSISGRLSFDVIQQAINDLQTRAIFISGPPQLIDEYNTRAQEIGIPNARIHTEEFALKS